MRFNDIPITFTHKSKKYAGAFSQVSGAGSSSSFYLMVDRYYIGQFFYSDHIKGWQFFSNSTPDLHELSAYFEYYMVSWHQ